MSDSNLSSSKVNDNSVTLKQISNSPVINLKKCLDDDYF